MKKNNISFWLFIGPALLAFIIVVLVPLLFGIYYSFTDWNGIDAKVINFVGISNYIKAFKDQTFLDSIRFTVKFTALSVIVLNLFGFGLALLVTRDSKLSNVFRTVFFMPNLIGGLILGFIWQFIFKEVFATIGQTFNIPWLQGWLSDGKTGFIGLMILMSWQMAGYLMIIYIAAIQNIPTELVEASKIDGANVLQRLKVIVLPMVRPAFTVSIFLTLANSFKLYDQNLSLTGGGPANSTQMMAMNIFNTAFKFNNMGIAQAKAFILFLIIAVITFTQVYISKKGEVEA